MTTTRPTQPSRLQTILLASLCGVLISIATSDFATAQESSSTKQYSSDLSMLISDEVFVDLDIVEGDTVQECMNLIQEQSDVHLNIFVKQDARDIRLPSIKLRHVSVQAAINAMLIATNQRLSFDFDESGEVAYFELYTGYTDELDISVFNLELLLENHDRESFLSAVEIGTEMLGTSQSTLQFKLHEETKTLFVKGSEAELMLVENLINQLGGFPNTSSMNLMMGNMLGGGGMDGGGGIGGSSGGGVGRPPRGGGSLGGGDGGGIQGGGGSAGGGAGRTRKD